MSAEGSFGRRFLGSALGTGRRGRAIRRGRGQQQYAFWRRCLAALLRVDLPVAPSDSRTPTNAQALRGRVGGHVVLRSTALLTVMLGGPALIGSGFGPIGMLVGLTAAVTGVLYAYRCSDRLALQAMRARPADESEAPQLHRIVRELSAAAHQPVPMIYVSPTPAPNAFAVGRSPQSAAVCCTEGLLLLLDERELRGVLGHELSHIHNRDSLISSTVGTIAGMTVLLASLVWLRLGRSEDEEGLAVIGALLIILLGGPLAAAVIRLGVSRSREHEADAYGAALTDDPLALASALRKIDAGTKQLPLPPEPGLQVRGHMMIADPFRPGTALSKLFSTHAPMRERVARLEKMAGWKGRLSG